eukprot:1976432-Rhodomonas_salina.1
MPTKPSNATTRRCDSDTATTTVTWPPLAQNSRAAKLPSTIAFWCFQTIQTKPSSQSQSKHNIAETATTHNPAITKAVHGVLFHARNQHTHEQGPRPRFHAFQRKTSAAGCSAIAPAAAAQEHYLAQFWCSISGMGLQKAFAVVAAVQKICAVPPKMYHESNDTAERPLFSTDCKCSGTSQVEPNYSGDVPQSV